jgi:hypothetical protein
MAELFSGQQFLFRIEFLFCGNIVGNGNIAGV